MRYVINIYRKVGINLYSSVFLQSYNDENKFNQALIIIEQSLKAIGIYRDTNIREYERYKVAEVNLKSLWDNEDSFIRD